MPFAKRFAEPLADPGPFAEPLSAWSSARSELPLPLTEPLAEHVSYLRQDQKRGKMVKHK